MVHSQKNRVNALRICSRIICLLAIFIALSSCYQLAMIKTMPKQDDITLTPEMKQFLGSHSNLSVVLRVPNSLDRVTTETASKNSAIYSSIEKKLMKAGFNVRDRALLETVLKSGVTNYAEIGKKIETDIIIEVLDIDWNIDNFQSYLTLKNNNKIKPVPVNTLNAKIAKLECKLTIVEKGSTGGVFTLYYTSCIDGCDFYALFWTDGSVAFADKKPVTSGEVFRQMVWSLDYNQEVADKVTDYWSSKIIQILQNNF